MYAVTMAGDGADGHRADHLPRAASGAVRSAVPHYVANGRAFRCFSIVAVAILAIGHFRVASRSSAPRLFVLMAVMGRIGRRIETRAAEREALLLLGSTLPMKKICIFGVNGFIGHHLSQEDPRGHRLGGLRHGHGLGPHRRPHGRSALPLSSKATSRSTRSGSNTTSASAT
jgi:hypothetical protein